MFSEDELLLLSALQHLMFCERQCALIHIEQVWSENVYTVQGQQLHEKADEAETETRGDMRIARGLKIRSLKLGLSGKMDIVEFHRVNNETIQGFKLPEVDGFWYPFPVEYKRGRPKLDHSDEVQLCAQALCLEEMLNVSVPAGAVFYGKPRRRLDVAFTPTLRAETEAAAARLHLLFQRGRTPPAVYEKKCNFCSLIELCMPKTISAHEDVEKYILRAIKNDAP